MSFSPTIKQQTAQPVTEVETLHPWRTLWQLARVYKGKFLIVVLFSLLATGTDLIAPQIYRTAVNDVAGLFVDTGEEAQIPEEETITPTPTLVPTASPTIAPALGASPAPTATPHIAKRAEHKRRRPRRTPHPAQAGQPQASSDLELEPPPEPHRSDYVASRTPRQTFNTLM
ncbi:MAG TPA: hypothetical protein PKC13_33450 [Blastocatellia bacterium]|nr:hypothetical protein [Blastocatellia bacterium]HMY72041.1 hypothetical protein [Blastocatellia bacterium]